MTLTLALATVVLVLAFLRVCGMVRRLERELEGIASPATASRRPGLPSRSGLVSLASTRHAGATDELGVIAFEIVDLGGIKDSLGYHIGQQVMDELTHRLETHTRATEDLARSGEDRFLLVLAPPITTHGAIRAASRLVDVLVRPVTVGETTVQVRIRAGAAVGPTDDAAAVLSNAEFALGRARQTGSSTPVLYDEAERAHAEVTFRRAQGLRTAVAENELTIAYQPILRLEDGGLAAAEALLRWESPTLGPVSPADFIPIAEDTGAIVEIGSWVLEQACRDLQHLTVGDSRPSISVNVSVHQLRHAGFADIVQTALIASGVDPGRLTLEVTESMFANPVEVIETLDHLRALGVRVALDDVGTGYSSLAQLANLPIDVMKLDRSLLARSTEPGDAAGRVFTSMAALGRSLDLEVVAEGVEDASQSRFAYESGCTHEQGFLRSRPLPLAAAAEFAQRIAASVEHR